MKQKLFFIAALWCMLFFINFNTAAQNQTFPLPAPGEGSSTLPAPVQGTERPASQGAPARERAQTPAPAPSGEAERGSETVADKPRPAAPVQARRPAAEPQRPAAEAPAQTQQPQPAAASAQTGIPSKGMFWGAYLGGGGDFYNSLEIYRGSDGYDDYGIGGRGGFNGGLLLGYDFGLLASQVEFVLTGDNGKVTINRHGYSGPGQYEQYWADKYKYRFSGTTIQIPLMFKLDLHWRRIMFQPQAGFYLNLTLGDLEFEKEKDEVKWGHVPSNERLPEELELEYDSPLFGFMTGAALGVRIGRGYLFMDGRFAIDLGQSKIKDKDRGTEMAAWNHSAWSVTLGYQHYVKGKQ